MCDSPSLLTAAPACCGAHPHLHHQPATAGPQPSTTQHNTRTGHVEVSDQGHPCMHKSCGIARGLQQRTAAMSLLKQQCETRVLDMAACSREHVLPGALGSRPPRTCPSGVSVAVLPSLLHQVRSSAASGVSGSIVTCGSSGRAQHVAAQHSMQNRLDADGAPLEVRCHCSQRAGPSQLSWRGPHEPHCITATSTAHLAACQA